MNSKFEGTNKCFDVTTLTPLHNETIKIIQQISKNLL